MAEDTSTDNTVNRYKDDDNIPDYTLEKNIYN